ncbi:MAG: 16S rRNA (cytosine(1402)-N(4))-methyltransferase RsmH [Candidatus Sumerlaeota bacterium]|nr:16S rRNA (cytosine(1402)-N(4))-methyltransferase RsmH [Candidatus Sumerlaeota bacterium]
MRYHPSVLVKEVVESLRPRAGGIYADCTCGSAGHAIALLEACPGARVVGIERDKDMAATARQRVLDLQIPSDRFALVEGSYRHLRSLLRDLAIAQLDGSLFDLGASALHFISSGRGFSFRSPDEFLDMRYDVSQGATAADLLAEMSEVDLERLFRDCADERWARRIARRIVEERARAPIRTAGQLASLIERAIPRKAWPPETHPATRCFMALRIRVNREFEEIEAGIPQAIDLLKPGGRIAIITFHSGEDRIVKRLLREAAGQGEGNFITGRRPAPRIKILTRKPLTPTEDEIARTAGARSAKLRVAEKLGPAA